MENKSSTNDLFDASKVAKGSMADRGPFEVVPSEHGPMGFTYQLAENLTFAARLKLARKNAGLSQSQLAEKVGIGQSSISHIESGKSIGSTFTARIAEACGVSPEWLEGNCKPVVDRRPKSYDLDKFTIRLPDGMRDRLIKAAHCNSQSATAEIVARLRASFLPKTVNWIPRIGDLVEIDNSYGVISRFLLSHSVVMAVVERSDGTTKNAEIKPHCTIKPASLTLF
jgi:transcriptional regulator with XRE-family HTH domain